MVDIIREHILSILKSNRRIDGRNFDEYRKCTVEYGVSKGAEGSARVVLGETEIIAGIKMEVNKPFPDTPNEGGIMINVELRPLSNPDFELGPPSFDAIEISRVVDRAIREGHAIDFKKLCIKEGELSWMIIIDVYPMNDAGNLIDAASLASLAALQDAKFPKLEKDNVVNYKESSGKKLQLKSMPLCCTVVKLSDCLLLDPGLDEENNFDSKLTVGVLEDGTICSMQKGGEIGLTSEEIDSMIEIAIKKTKEIRKVLAKWTLQNMKKQD